jgi:hypothetical protein
MAKLFGQPLVPCGEEVDAVRSATAQQVGRLQRPGVVDDQEQAAAADGVGDGAGAGGGGGLVAEVKPQRLSPQV